MVAYISSSERELNRFLRIVDFYSLARHSISMADQGSQDIIRRQINWYREHIAVEAHRLYTAEKEFQSLQTPLNQFLEHYYQEVGVLFAELSQLNKKSSSPGVPTPEMVGEDSRQSVKAAKEQRSGGVEEKPKNAENTPPERDIKTLYRRLVKYCHPDSYPGDPDAAQVFALLTKAHQEGDLQMMIQVEQALTAEGMGEGTSSVAVLECLEREYDILLQKYNRISQSYVRLKQSPEFELFQKSELQGQQGKDLVQTIKANIHQRLSESKKELS